MVRSMWLFKHKFHADGTLSRYKVRLVANGSRQQLGVDFDETFSPVVKSATVRTVLSLVVSRKWPIHQLDVKNGYLNSDLSETVYIHQPPGFVDNRYPHHVYLLQRSLYGLKQVPRFSGSLNNKFDMTDLGAPNYFLGISVDVSLTIQQILPLPIADPGSRTLLHSSISGYVSGGMRFWSSILGCKYQMEEPKERPNDPEMSDNTKQLDIAKKLYQVLSFYQTSIIQEIYKCKTDEIRINNDVKNVEKDLGVVDHELLPRTDVGFVGETSPINVGTDKKRCHNRLNKGRMDLEYSKQVQEELLISKELDKMPIDGAQVLNYVVLIDKP
ncbi:ribonuclease H-like domain-containing protein [Tanacetum coccineum]